MTDKKILNSQHWGTDYNAYYFGFYVFNSHYFHHHHTIGIFEHKIRKNKKNVAFSSIFSRFYLILSLKNEKFEILR